MENEILFVGIVVIIIFTLMLVISLYISRLRPIRTESPEKRAGREGEYFVSNLIREVLNEDDLLINNVVIRSGDRQTELDNLIINPWGLFIIEAKNYIGELSGNEDDPEWYKIEMTSAGNLYQKSVKNPINQVKRQVEILSEYLLSEYFRQIEVEEKPPIRIEGYVFLVERNSPVKSRYILDTRDDIDRVIHKGAAAVNKGDEDAYKDVEGINKGDEDAYKDVEDAPKDAEDDLDISIRRNILSLLQKED
ncbi:MAG: NERD domain-containing protein [Lachnospiraceae bacterium]|nr:NERD domain-containing protein [Lachnospiraceae bacterium]